MNYRIEKASFQDIDAIAGFQVALVLETDHLEPDRERMRNGVRRVFEEPGIGFYLVARDGSGAVAGCLLLQREWSDWRNSWVWWMHSVYVVPEHRRRGIISGMLAYAEELARAEDGAGLRLYVEANNEIAKAAYRRAGLAPGYYEFFEKMF
jgi:ribosomal protein S18 acetylase RimI-like enzyme